jgi:hypothetical protein
MSASKDALRLTTATIDRRAFYFRNLVVLIVLLALACPIAALVFWSPRPLVGWLAAVPLCAGHLVVDNRLVARWRSGIQAMWGAGQLHLEDFERSVTSLKMLPAATLRSMLATLPKGPSELALDRLPTETKRNLVEIFNSLNACERDRTIAYAAAYSACAASIGGAALTWDWRPLLVIPAAGLSLVATVFLLKWRFQRSLGRQEEWTQRPID